MWLLLYKKCQIVYDKKGLAKENAKARRYLWKREEEVTVESYPLNLF